MTTTHALAAAAATPGGAGESAALDELVRLQDAAREKRAAWNAKPFGSPDADAAWSEYDAALMPYEAALYAYIARTGRGKRAYDDIQHHRATMEREG